MSIFAKKDNKNIELLEKKSNKIFQKILRILNEKNIDFNIQDYFENETKKSLKLDLNGQFTFNLREKIICEMEKRRYEAQTYDEYAFYNKQVYNMHEFLGDMVCEKYWNLLHEASLKTSNIEELNKYESYLHRHYLTNMFRKEANKDYNLNPLAFNEWLEYPNQMKIKETCEKCIQNMNTSNSYEEYLAYHEQFITNHNLLFPRNYIRLSFLYEKALSENLWKMLFVAKKSRYLSDYAETLYYDVYTGNEPLSIQEYESVQDSQNKKNIEIPTESYSKRQENYNMTNYNQNNQSVKTCIYCGGLGFQQYGNNESDRASCPYCSGKGVVYANGAHVDFAKKVCIYCGGLGFKQYGNNVSDRASCPYCNGSGRC